MIETILPIFNPQASAEVIRAVLDVRNSVASFAGSPIQIVQAVLAGGGIGTFLFIGGRMLVPTTKEHAEKFEKK